MPRALLLIGVALGTLCFHFLQPATAQITHPLEVTALRAIHNQLIDPKNNLRTWSTGDPCTSNWTGVLCFNTTSADGYYHVKELELLKLNLSGTLAPEIGQLSHLKILDVMWNQISGFIPKEIGNITSLELLLLNGNQLSGHLPEELGYLPNLDRIQIDQNQISGPIPHSFAFLNKTRHFHMNNNSLSGQIPGELSRLPSLVHLLLDNNKLTGYLPPELSMTPKLLIVQLDNNNFSGASIPATYGSMTKLLKLSLRNCSLQGEVPDLSGISQLGYLDLSENQLTGTIPTNKLSSNITTIDLSNNFLGGSIPANFSGLPNLQRLSLENNHLNGSVPNTIWENISFTGNKTLILLYGNPVCSNPIQNNMEQYCLSESVNQLPGSSGNSKINCSPCPTDLAYEYNPFSPIPCFCAIPLEVGYRLKSPGFYDFVPYINKFEVYLTSGLVLALYQLVIDSYIWLEGPRLGMKLKLFPDNTSMFSDDEILRIRGMFTGWLIPDSDIFGPYELLNFTLGSYLNVISKSPNSGLSTGATVGIVLSSVVLAVIISSIFTVFIMKKRSKYLVSKKTIRLVCSMKVRFTVKRNIFRPHADEHQNFHKVDGVKAFTFEEMAFTTNNFSSSSQIGEGGYGKVYKGILADGSVVAVKRAEKSSLQGSREFCTEIELLSRLHHRNLVSLLGYCDEENEQMLVYEFMDNGSLHDHLSEADPPIFHRDIKATNILLDSR
ncbi:hypothetical protein HPP92_013807 [Vanilla planifolia]|uniref:non-specific serine/threonine protein kinase n=2 Tax=Vanilla planifolia TaxID=51239 RepID=A0A835R354_VANPL|nr:hypothetical protein HPP92_013807 [Vanilla planifolia]